MADNKRFVAKNGLDNSAKTITNLVDDPLIANTAATKGYVDDRDADIRNDIEAHTSDTANPHGTTANQIGAISKIGNKGTLISFSAPNTSATLAAGPNGQVLRTNSAATTGLEWVDPVDTVYELPIASSTTLGGVKDGSNITIDETGVLSLDDNINVTSIVTGAITIGTKHKAEEYSGFTIFRYIG